VRSSCLVGCLGLLISVIRGMVRQPDKACCKATERPSCPRADDQAVMRTVLQR
jgi:hypothetical protein